VVYIQKWSWGGGGEYPWWQYMKRREPSFQDFKDLQKRFPKAEAMAYGMSMSSVAKYGSNSIEGVGVFGSTHQYDRIWEFELAEGRYFTELESNSGPNVAIIGSDIAQGLFQGKSAEGKKIGILGRKFRVIGVFEKKGKSLVGENQDELILVPTSTMLKLASPEKLNGNMIMVRAGAGMSFDEFKSELRGVFRTIRRLKPKVDDDFSLNEISLVANGLDQLFGVIGAAGTVIGLFSVLVGGFGIANIMFVSVKERTNQIGIQKALGARNAFILMQFLAEAVLLSLIGGLVGLGVVLGIIPFVEDLFDFEVFMSLQNVWRGISIAVGVGLVSGTIPALLASRLDPVEAIRSGI
jgi:putative ABC transport system permease protein